MGSWASGTPAGSPLLRKWKASLHRLVARVLGSCGSSHDAELSKLDTVNTARSHVTIQQDSSRGQSEVLETQCWDGVSFLASTVDCT